jgi:transposase-like protein
MVNEGAAVSEVARSLGVTETTWHRWKNTYGGMKATDAKKLKVRFPKLSRHGSCGLLALSQ